MKIEGKERIICLGCRRRDAQEPRRESSPFRAETRVYVFNA